MSQGDHPGVVLPPPLIYFGFLAIAWGLQVWLHAPDLGLTLEARRGAAITLILAGLLLDGMAAGLFRRRDTAVEPWKPSTTLVTEGPYRFSRNPIYVGYAVTYIGLAVAMDNWFALGLLFPCLLAIDHFVIGREERYLSAKFGAAYQAYRARVRRWL
ncbi:MAG: methyltransferase family protein [Brevundimonas sp.]